MTTGEGAIPDLSFIILTWNSEKFLRLCFDSIIRKCEGEGLAYEVIVIDNGSSDGSHAVFDLYEQEMPANFRFIRLQRNRGTTLPRNVGLALAEGSHICILDSDTELGDGSLTDLLARLDESENIGLIAPRLMLDDGSVQHSIKKFPTFFHKLIKIPKMLLGAKVPTIEFYNDFPFATPREVHSAISACWFFKKELLDEVGLLDENIFYAPEDLDFCMRIHKTGKKILYSPYFTVKHHTQQISHKKPFSKVSRSHFWGLIYYFRKHGGWVNQPRFKLKLND